MIPGFITAAQTLIITTYLTEMDMLMAIIGLLIIVGLFIALRIVALWYFKINVIITIQKEQLHEQKITNALLAEQNDLLRGIIRPAKQPDNQYQ